MHLTFRRPILILIELKIYLDFIWQPILDGRKRLQIRLPDWLTRFIWLSPGQECTGPRGELSTQCSRDRYITGQSLFLFDIFRETNRYVNRNASVKITRRAAVSACSALAFGTAGCFESTSTSQASPFRIGLLTRRLPEPFGDWGMQSGAELAAREINRDGGIDGAEIDVLARDVTDPPDEGTHYNRLQNDHDVDVTMGFPPRAGESDPLWPLEHHDPLHFTLGTWGPELSTLVAERYDTYKNHFRIGMPNSAELAAPFASFVDDHSDARGWERCAIYIEQPDRRSANEAFGTTLATRLPSSIDVYSVDRVRQSRDIGPYLDEVRDADVDVLFTAITSSYGKLVDQINRNEIDIDVGGFHRPSTHSSFWEVTNGTCRGTFSVSPMTSDVEHTERMASFVTAYEERFGALPEHPAAIAYDAVYVYKQAIEQTLNRQSASEKPTERQVIQTLLDGTFSGRTLYPKYEFSGPDHTYPHEPIWESMASENLPIIEQWQPENATGIRTVVAPTAHRNATFE
jgi:branched-chain amino acid transport system substrate-binding protein